MSDLPEVFPHQLPTGEPSTGRLMLTYDSNGNATRHTVAELTAAMAGIQVVNTAAALKALPSKTTTVCVLMLGNSSAFDGYGHLLYFALGSTDTADDSSVFQPDDWASAGAAQGKYKVVI